MKPTHVTFNTMLHATGRSFRHYERAYELFEEMKAAGFAHDTYSYNTILLACRCARMCLCLCVYVLRCIRLWFAWLFV